MVVGWTNRWLRRGMLFVAVFIALVCWHHATLDAPPTPDQIVGIWLEGNYLAANDFDYRRLFFDELPASQGGPRTYMFSVLPTVVAVFVKMTPDPSSAILAYHFFCIACAALALTLLFELTDPFAGPVAATLLLIAVATTPLFSVQTALAGMEMPLTACTMLVAYSLSKNHYGVATVAAVAAFFVKSNALVLLVVVITCILVRLGLRKNDDPGVSTKRLAAVALTDAVLIVMLGVIHVLGVLT